MHNKRCAVGKSPKQPPRLDDPVTGTYRYHLARQAAVAGNVDGINTHMRAALTAAPDQPRYQWWQSAQAAKRFDTATLAKTLPASFRSMIDSPIGRGPFVIAAHQTILLATALFWTILVGAVYLGWWRNIAHDFSATLLKNPKHTPRLLLPAMLPLLALAFKPGWLGLLAVLSVPLLIHRQSSDPPRKPLHNPSRPPDLRGSPVARGSTRVARDTAVRPVSASSKAADR